jgi:hypothetical protein
MAASNYSSTDFLSSSGSGSFLNAGPNVGSKAGKKPMTFGWDTAILGAGMGLQSIMGAFGQQSANQLNANVANAQMAAQADAIVNARETQKGNLGMGIFNQVYGTGTGADLEFGRQLAAKRKQFSEFLPKQMGLGREETRWNTAFQTSPESLEASRRERIGNLQEKIAGYAAQPTGMFGPIRRINIESLAG